MSEERDLRAALQHAVAQVCMEEEMTDSSAQMSTQAVAALSELTFQYATMCLANDVVSFSRHANRRTVTVEDVLLVARKDPQGLHCKLTAFAEREKLFTSRKDAKPNSSSKKKSKAKKLGTPPLTQRMKELQERLKKGVDSCTDSDSDSSSDVQMLEKPPAKPATLAVVNLDDDSDDNDDLLVLDGKENQKKATTKANKAIDDDPFASSDDDDAVAAKMAKKAPVAQFPPGGTKSGFSSDESDENMFDD